MQNFRNLKVWAKAHKVTLAAYKATETFPKTEQYGLTAQIRRSAASVCANIAEGCGRGGRIEFARFLQIAFGSASELEYHLILAATFGSSTPRPTVPSTEQSSRSSACSRASSAS